MRLALHLASQAAEEGEVPVAAVLVQEGRCLAAAYNRVIGEHDPSAHAEIRVLREAGRYLHNYRFPGSTLYVTLEPCVMCVGALVHARVSQLVFGAYEPRAGAVESKARLLATHPFNWKLDWQGGVLAQESAALLSGFFQRRRKSSAE